MKEVAERIRDGSTTDLPKLAQPRVGTAGRGQTAADCNHWLPKNRFDWFTAKPPPTGEIKGAQVTALRDEFCGPLSTVVGGRLLDLPVPDEQGISWADLPDNASPNSIPGIGFWVRTTRPESVPFLQTQTINIGTSHVPVKLLINGTEEGFEPGPGRRPSLFIDFPIPQRAVALEFGYIGNNDHLDQSDVQLIPYDSEGERILFFDSEGRSRLLESNAEAIHQGQILAGNVFYEIGVRDREGGIATVELRFNGSDGSATQVVSRIWHEALPPAAVTQGTLVTEGGRGSFAEFTGALGQLPDPVDRDGNPIHFRTERTLTIPLPFRFDRGVVMLRGFKLQTLDQIPREVQRIAVEVNPRQTGPGVSPSQTPGVFRVRRGGSVTLEPGGALVTRERGAFGYRVHIYFTLVCWDSDQVDVAIEQGKQDLQLQQEDVASGRPLILTDPCFTSGRSQGCGPLFGALQGFEFRMPQDQEVEELNLAIGASVPDAPGSSGLRPAAFPGMIAPEDFAIPDLRRVGSHLEWGFGSFLAGGHIHYTSSNPATAFSSPLIGSNPYSRTVRGAVMTGSGVQSVLAFGERKVVLVPRVGPRPAPSTFFGEQVADMNGDLAFVSLSAIYFRPEGPIREMEMEVLGADFNGRALRCQVGSGLSTSPPITGGAFSSGGLDGLALPVPIFGSLSRRSVDPRSQLLIQPDVEFSGHVGMLSLLPTQFGAIRNDGNIPALITGVQKSGPQADEFMILFERQGNILEMYDIQARGPVVLAPGETLLVGGRFFPGAEAGPADPPRIAFLEFQTNVANAPTVTLTVRGRTKPQDAQGDVLPAVANFGVVRIFGGRRATRDVLLVSGGHTPLLVHSISLEDDSLGFTWGILQGAGSGSQLSAPGTRYQVDPGGIMIIQITFPAPGTPGTVTPQALGLRQTRLIFETNAGTLEVQLVAQGTNE